MENGDLRPPESYALAGCLGCGIMALTLCLVGVGIWRLVAWLA
jgi:hypothetical protein